MKWRLKAKGWVFISHSSKDYESVRIVRNYLEENGLSDAVKNHYVEVLKVMKENKYIVKIIEFNEFEILIKRLINEF